MLFILRQVVGDREPRRLGADEDVPARADAGIVQKASQGDVDEGAVADHRIEQRAAPPAVRVIGVFFALDKEIILALGEAEFAALDAGERLEGRPGRPPAIRAVAVHGVAEFVRHRVVDGAAEAFSGKHLGHDLRPSPS